MPLDPTLQTRGTFIDGVTTAPYWNALLRFGYEFRLSNDELTREPVIRFDLLRLSMRVDSLVNGRGVVTELPGERLQLGSQIDVQIGVGIGFGFFVL